MPSGRRPLSAPVREPRNKRSKLAGVIALRADSVRRTVREKQRSRTAEAAAAVRAAHVLYDRPVIFADPFAIRLTSRTWRVICCSAFLHWLVVTKLLGPLRPAHGQILGRARYAEDKLDEAIRRGISQYVIIGAGLDSFALRRPDVAGAVRIYEVDHPATQRSKRERLADLGLRVPENLEFVSVDLENGSLREALATSTYSPSDQAFFSWLGTVPYLTLHAFFRTLELIRSVARPGSEIVFDYGISKRLLALGDVATLERLERFTQRRGEPLIDKHLDPETLASEVGALGFELLENLSPEEQKARYFTNRCDDLRPLAWSYFAHFRVTG